MAAAGVLLGVALLIYLAVRGVNVLVASLIAAVVVALTNDVPLTKATTEDFVGSMMKFAGQYLLVFLMGAIFGRVMGESKAAASIALAVTRWLGAERVMWVMVLACALLTYGGVNLFILIFTIYPLSMSLFQHANLPKRLLVGPMSLGAGTFTMTALPGSPSIHNIICAKGLGTSLIAGPWIGLLASAVMFFLGMWYLERERRRAELRGENFKPGPNDSVPDHAPDPCSLPHPAIAMIPLVAVLLTIVVPLWVSELAYAKAEELPTLLKFSKEQPILWICVAMIVGTLLGLIIFVKTLPSYWAVISRGAENSIMPLVNTAAVIGFGGVVGGTEAFKWFAGLMIESNLPPLLSASFSINILSGIVGSASGGLGIFMQALAPKYLELGVDPATLHRVVAIGSGGLDSLPHSGAVISFLTVLGLTHREAYKDVFVITVVIPLIALAAVLVCLAAMGIR